MLGHALIRMGHRLQGGWGCSLRTPGAGGAVDAPRTSVPEALRG
jgi:hypothetical protein